MHGYHNGIEEVGGIVIGPILTAVTLHSPCGTEMARTSCATMDEAQRWAEETRVKCLAEVGRHEAGRLGWNAPWEMRWHE